MSIDKGVTVEQMLLVTPWENTKAYKGKGAYKQWMKQNNKKHLICLLNGIVQNLLLAKNSFIWLY